MHNAVYPGTITLSGNDEFRIGTGNSTTLNFNGAISRSGTNLGLLLLQSGTGTIHVNAPIDNNGGGLQFTSASGGGIIMNSAGNDLGDVAVFYGAYVKLGITNPPVTTRNLQIGLNVGSTSTDATGATGSFDLGGYNQTVSALNGSKGYSTAASDKRVITNTAASTTSILTASSGTFDGVIKNGSGPNAGIVALVKTGTVTLTLNGNLPDAYTGDTTINGGKLTLGSAKDIANTSTVRISGSTSILELPAGVTDTVASLVINGVTMTAGTWGGTDSGAANIDTTHFTGTGKLNVTTGAAVPDYTIWANSYLPADVSNQTGDYDNDGFTNLEEYAFGLSPVSGSSVNPITQVLDKTSGVFKYTRRKPALTGLVYTCEYSQVLDNDWAAFSPESPDQIITADPAGNESVTVDVPDLLLANPNLFIRVRAN